MIEILQTSPDDNEKRAYVRNIRSRLAVKQERLEYIKRKVKKAAESRRIQVSEQLLNAERHADSSIKALRRQLELLLEADNGSWSSSRHEVEAAWDELSQAIKKVVARFP